MAADVYHVPVSGLFGSTEPYHLIAFKEDSEFGRPLPEAQQDAIPMDAWASGIFRVREKHECKHMQVIR